METITLETKTHSGYEQNMMARVTFVTDSGVGGINVPWVNLELANRGIVSLARKYPNAEITYKHWDR